MELLWRFLKQNKKILGGVLVLGTINQVFSLLDPQIFRLLVDNYAAHATELTRNEFLRGVGLLLLASIGAAFVSRVAKNFQDYYNNVVIRRVGAQLYSTSVSHSFSLPYAAFEDQRSGELLQKLQKARNDGQQLITNLVNVIFLSLVGIIFVVVYSFTVYWVIGVVYFAIIPILGVITFYLSSKTKAAQQQIVKETANLAGSTTETLRNVELVKSLGLEAQETKRLNDVNEQILKLELQKIILIRKLGFIQGTTLNFMRSMLMLLMLWFIFAQVITLGEFFSLLFYSFFIFTPLGEFGRIASDYQETKASMEQLQQILDTKSEDKPLDPVKIGPLETIEFAKTSFAYASIPTPSLKEISARIIKGQKVAFVGPSGSGKTTLMKLMLGLYKPTAGKVLLNGISNTEIDYEDVRRRVGYVSQDTQLFAGTIRDNLLFVKPNATDKECLEALEHASATTIIDRGGEGLDTKIGEGGIKLSGGEKQRLAIARALLRQPELIVFDEATSSLDSITEKAITDTIRNISNVHSHLMTVMVAHRLSTISHADRIYVLERGAVVEEGTHDELIKAGNLYAALWREQAGQSNT